MRAAPALLALAAALACLAPHARASGRGFDSSGFSGAARRVYLRTQTDIPGQQSVFKLEAWDFSDKAVVWAVESPVEYFVDSADAAQVRTLAYDQDALAGPDGRYRLLLETYDAATGEKTASEPFADGDIAPPPVALPSGEIFAVTFDIDDPTTGNLETGLQTFSQPSGKKFVSVLNSEKEGESPDIEELAASPVDNVVYFPYSFDQPRNRVSRYDASGDKEPVTAAVGEPLDEISIYGTAYQKDHMFVYGMRMENQNGSPTVSASKVSKDLSTVAWTYTAHLSANSSYFSATPLSLQYIEGYIVFHLKLAVEEGVDSAILKDKNSAQSTTFDLAGASPILLLFLDAETGDMKRAVTKNPSDASDNYRLTDNPVFYDAESETIILAGEFPNGSGQYVSDIDIESDLDALGVPQC